VRRHRARIPGPFDVVEEFLAGTPFGVRIVMRNTGETPWLPGFAIALESADGRFPDLDAVAGTPTFPGRTRELSARIAAPWRPGPLALGWQMRIE
jgi:hypothetical protein